MDSQVVGNGRIDQAKEPSRGAVGARPHVRVRDDRAGARKGQQAAPGQEADWLSHEQ